MIVQHSLSVLNELSQLRVVEPTVAPKKKKKKSNNKETNRSFFPLLGS